MHQITLNPVLSSPCLDNRYYSKFYKDNSELLNRIRGVKRDLVYKHIVPTKDGTVRKEIIESWVDSYKKGFDILKPARGPVLSRKEFKVVLKEKDDLVKITNHYFSRIKPIFENTNCIFVLSDEQGVHLTDTFHKQERYIELGEIGNQDTIGTSAQSISITKEIPIQVLGPEHYFEEWSSGGASACPIFDFNHNLVGVLSICSINKEDQSPQTLGLAVAIALSIQNELNAELNHNLMNLFLEIADKGVVILNNKGYITKVNDKARDMLHVLNKGVSGRYFEDVFGNQPAIKEVLEDRCSLKNTDIEFEKMGEKYNIQSIHALQVLNKNYGYVLLFKKRDYVRHGTASKGQRDKGYTFKDIVGTSPVFLKSVTMAKKLSHSDANILLLGESGTGKDLFAQAIHNASRPTGPFIPVNCAAIPRTLIESELFGYEGGAFTGAERKGRVGKIEMANGGTLFLDEIGDMPLELQPILLRVLEEKKFMRVGGNRFISVDFRLIAATHHDLLTLVQKNLFRQDLYYRLAAFKIEIPPLRTRGSDIMLLTRHFLEQICHRKQIPTPVLSPGAEYQLMQYDWPGNVRQLYNAILYAVNISSGSVINYEDLPEEIKMKTLVSRSENDHRSDDPLSLKDLQESIILETLLKNNNNIAKTARELGISRTTIYRKIKDLGIIK